MRPARLCSSPGIVPALVVAGVLGACSGDHGPSLPAGGRVAVTIDGSAAAGRLDERWLGYAFDTSQVTGGAWWIPGGTGIEPTPLPPMEDARFRRLAEQLGPAILRVGGTDCDGAYFCDREEGDCELPDTYAETFREEERFPTILTRDTVRRIGDFAAAVDAEILFCLNAGPGPRDPDTGDWDDSNARALVRYARSLPTGERFRHWELGNEVNSLSITTNMPVALGPRRYADELIAVRALLDAEAPGTTLRAPGSFVTPFGELPPLTGPLRRELEARGAGTPDTGPLDAMSWHLYATQSDGCGALVIDEATPEVLHDETLTAERLRPLARAARRAGGGYTLWNTESASAQCGGQAGLSDTQHDALWYADWIGIMAEEGNTAVIRHSLIGVDYSLIDRSLAERPTYVTLVALRRTLGGVRLATAVDRTELRVHGFCARGDDADALVVVVSNPRPEGLVAEVVLDGGALTGGRRFEVAPVGGDPGSSTATLEGEPVAASGDVPDPRGVTVPARDGRAYVTAPPWTVVVARLDADASLDACR